ncbi:VOC family protein [Aurantimonas sp. A3-2-R12]|uniref:VOC family protein n=1 Tax=Aurantimonas sp. A3-2-R12 TaxID=3114362 RepID=UPI002E1869E2|nr:VOC family protein [Aurantimonas sp. A3-2-R12]
MPRFIHIDISAEDPQRAVDFYTKVFGWHAQKLEGPMPYWLIRTTSANNDEPAINAGVAKREEAWQTVTPTIDVPSADAYTKKIEAEGGSIIQPKTLIPDIGYLVSFKDTEGNVFAILEPVEGNPFAGY